ncbi:MAG: hypothetical protein ABSG53_08595, partial [Thermoguttaceae bacterium]
MFRQGWTVALLLVTAFVSLTLTIVLPGCSKQTSLSNADAHTPKIGTGGKTTVTTQAIAAGPNSKAPPREIDVGLGSGVKLEMVLISAGEFMMGSPDSAKSARDDEKPQHRVRITKR